MGVDRTFSLYYGDRTNSARLAMVRKMARLETIIEYPRCKVQRLEGRFKPALAVHRGWAEINAAFAGGQELEDLNVLLRAEEPEWGILPLQLKPMRPTMARDVDRLCIHLEAAAFEGSDDEIRFLDKCIGNVLNDIEPDCFIDTIEHSFEPTPEDIRFGWPGVSIPSVGYFPPKLVKSMPNEYWRSLTSAILSPSPDFGASIEIPAERPWVRIHASGGILYKLARQGLQEQDLQLCKAFDGLMKWRHGGFR